VNKKKGLLRQALLFRLAELSQQLQASPHVPSSPFILVPMGTSRSTGFRLQRRFVIAAALLLGAAVHTAHAQATPAQAAPDLPTITHQAAHGGFALAAQGVATPVYVAAGDSETVRTVATAFAGDIHSVSGLQPRVLNSLRGHDRWIIAGTLGHCPAIDQLVAAGKLDTEGIAGQWEAAGITIVDHPFPGVRQALVIAGSDRRGVAYALFSLSRAMGVSPWNWWADVPVRRSSAIYFSVTSPATHYVQHSPSVPYRGIFLNDEDWGLRPWAAKKMDPQLDNIGPHTYARIFELLLRLRANSLWPAMHPGTLAFNAVAENARLADTWGIVMGSSHSEALLRNNVGEWNEQRDGPWNYQRNAPAIDRYWDKRVAENGQYENFYTVGMRGVHDTGLEATGSDEVKARLVENVMAAQRAILTKHIDKPIDQIPQVIWLYKESLALYRAGMQVPPDVTLGWTDDNYGYLRQLPDAEEQKRSGGSGIYYHVSYWGFPHDYLWLCTTPPALIREEMTKAFDHGARRYWVLNVGDLKPAEPDIDYFMQLAWDEPALAAESQQQYLQSWLAEQLSPKLAGRAAAILSSYYALNFIRKPEFMGFNGYDDGINRTHFNPLAWGDQNAERLHAWQQLSKDATALGAQVASADREAYFELVGYPVQAAAAQNAKFLWTDRSYLDAHAHNATATRTDAAKAHAAYAEVQSLTTQYNSLENGKWQGMLSAAPRERQVFAMPVTAAELPSGSQTSSLPASWGAGSNKASTPQHAFAFDEDQGVVSMNAAHFNQARNGTGSTLGAWQVLPSLGISGSSVTLAPAGALHTAPDPPTPQSPSISYIFTTAQTGDATLRIYRLPTFPVDSAHRLRYAVSIDTATPVILDSSGNSEWHEGNAPAWSANVLRNAAIEELPLPHLAAGRHTVRLYPIDPGLVFEHLTIRFAGTAPAYPVPPETLESFPFPE
jgi:hypothetical protein